MRRDRALAILRAHRDDLRRLRARRLALFRAHPSVLPATLYYLAVIGEAAARIPEEVARSQPEVPWAEMRAQRNFIVHRYADVDPEVIWDTLRSDTPTLTPLLRALLQR